MSVWAILGVAAVTTFIGEVARWKHWTTAGRTRAFIALAIGIAVWDPPHPWGFIFACVCYMWLLYPQLDRGGAR